MMMMMMNGLCSFSVAMYLKEILNEANMKASFGIVQTAYANGNATRYASHDLVIVSFFSTF